ncbi:MAG: DUF1641 domain-containing protein [Actinomycetota bacterium]
MVADALDDTVHVSSRIETERLLDRLEDPKTAAALHSLLDNAELLAVLVTGLDGLARKGEVVGDTLAEVLHEVRAAGRSTGLDPMTTSRQLGTLIPTLAAASPAINRILDSPIVEPEPIDVLSETAVALVAGLRAAQANETQLGPRGLYKATKDPDVQRGLGFLVEVARVFGREIASGQLAVGPADEPTHPEPTGA